MKKTKWILASLLILALGGMPALAADDSLRVAASFYPMYVAVLNIARDVPDVTVDMMAPPSAGCLHDYQMTTDDRRLLADADVLVINGAGLESFMDRVLPELDATVIEASEGLALLEDEHHGVNAHVWVSLSGMIGAVQNIADGLAACDEAHAEQYQANAQAYIDQLRELQAQMREQLAPYAGAPIVTFHEAFDYFALEFDLDIVATVQGEHGSAPSARDLAALADLIRERGVRALFAEPQYEDTSVDLLARETGLPVYLLDPAVSGTASVEDLDAYLRTMRHNADTIAEALR